MLDRLKKLVSARKPGSDPDWAPTGRYRSPSAIEAERQTEPVVRQRLEQGDMEAWKLLSALLSDLGREAEAAELREHLATTASQPQVARLVELSSQNFDAVSGARFQVALITRFPSDVGALEHCAALLAETGSFDEAMRYFREALRIGNSWPYFPKYPMRTLRALTAGDRWDDAEELLRAYPAELYALSVLALLLQVRGRTAEGEDLLRQHPAADHLVSRLTLYTLLERDGRRAEAAALRPAEGWPHERFGTVPRQRMDHTGAPGDHPHWAVWEIVDVWGRATAI